MGDCSETSGSLLIRDVKVWRFVDEGKTCKGRLFHNRETLGTKVRSKWDVLDVFKLTAKGCKSDAPRICRLGTIIGGTIEPSSLENSPWKYLYLAYLFSSLHRARIRIPFKNFGKPQNSVSRFRRFIIHQRCQRQYTKVLKSILLNDHRYYNSVFSI